MRTARWTPTLLLAIMALAVTAPAATQAAEASPRESLLVDVAWLAAHIDDPKLVLLHVGDAAEYAAAHLPRAQLLPYRDPERALWASDHSGKGLMLEMLPAEALRTRLEKLGISDDSRVVVYYGKDWISPSTRVLFTLDHAGLGSVSLLDGGQTAWVVAGHPTTADVPVVTPGKLRPLTLRPTVVDAAFVREHRGKPGFALVDGRSRSFYDGVETGGSHDVPHKTGHIAGADSVPFTDVVGDDLKWKSPADLAALFEKAGVKSGDTVIGYCHIGQQATAMLFAARTLGHPVVLYDGSFEDWSRTDGPVEAAAAPKKPEDGR